MNPRTTRRRSTRDPLAGLVLVCGSAAGLILVAAAVPAAAAWRDLQRTDPPPPAVSPAAFEPEGSVALPVADDTVAVPPAKEGGSQPLSEPRETTGASDTTGGDDGSPTKAAPALRQLTRQDLDIRVVGEEEKAFPHEDHVPEETFEPRRFATTTFTWKAAGYCHKPLYFEHWNLERYGHSHGFVADSFLSAAHFFGRLPALPYQMGVELPWECVYPLGYYRPGSCAPWTVPAVPVSARGLAVGAATATGIVFLLP